MKRLLTSLFVLLGFSTLAIPLKDIPFQNASAVPSFYIRNNGTYSMFITRDSIFNNNLSLYIYDAFANHTNQIPIPVTGIFTNIATSYDIGFAGDGTVVIAGSSGSNPSLFFPKIYEFTLGNQTPIPTSLTLVTNFTTGVADCQQCEIVSCTNGGVVVFFALNVTNNLINATYRKPNGTWTNPPTFEIWGTNTEPTLIGAAEMPGANTVWLFDNKDSAGWISAGEWSLSSNGNPGLFFVRSFQLIYKTPTGDLSPYGEITFPRATYDTATNRILLYYNDDYRTIFPSDPSGVSWITHGTLAGFTETTNFYKIGVTTETGDREMRACVSQVGTNYTFAFAHMTGPPITNAGPFYGQVFYNNGTNTTLNAGIVGKPSTFGYRDNAQEYIMQYPNGTYHLIIQPFNLLPPVLNVSTFIQGRVRVSGRVFIK